MAGSILGYSKLIDTSIINDFLSKDYFLDSLPMKNTEFLWEANSSSTSTDGIPLINSFLIDKPISGKAILDGS